ncbi:hypothetical protein D3C75_1088370 [compost metagenome]
MDQQLRIFHNGQNGDEQPAQQQEGFLAGPVVIGDGKCQKQEQGQVHQNAQVLKRQGIGGIQHQAKGGCKGQGFDGR